MLFDRCWKTCREWPDDLEQVWHRWTLTSWLQTCRRNTLTSPTRMWWVPRSTRASRRTSSTSGNSTVLSTRLTPGYSLWDPRSERNLRWAALLPVSQVVQFLNPHRESRWWSHFTYNMSTFLRSSCRKKSSSNQSTPLKILTVFSNNAVTLSNVSLVMKNQKPSNRIAAPKTLVKQIPWAIHLLL